MEELDVIHPGGGLCLQAVSPDLGMVVSGICPGRERAEERTMAMNLGLALADLAIAPEIYKRAKERGLGTRLDL